MPLGLYEGRKVFVYLSNKTNFTEKKLVDGEFMKVGKFLYIFQTRQISLKRSWWMVSCEVF